MRFNLAIFGMILAGTALAVPAREAFESNREKILAETTSVIGEWVFSVGRARQTLRTGDEIGFSKAAILAYSNLDLVNFKSAPWPASVDAEERKAAWMIYRSKHPFGLTLEGGQRIYSSKTENDRYLVVMSFPRAKVFMDTPRREDLDAAVSQCREELKRLAEEVEKTAAERCATNRLDAQKTRIEGMEKAGGGVGKQESFEADLML